MDLYESPITGTSIPKLTTDLLLKGTREKKNSNWCVTCIKRCGGIILEYAHATHVLCYVLCM